MIEKINGDLDSMEFTIDLNEYGRVFADIEDVTWFVKKEQTDADVDAIMIKKLSVGATEMEISDAGNNIVDVSVKWVLEDFPGFNINTVYDYAGLFIKWVGQTTSDEKVDNLFQIRILQDTLEN